MDAIVGYTGFVGSNLVLKHDFAGKYNSKNIEEAYGTNPDLLVYSGVRAEMFLANKNPQADLEIIENAIENIKKINPKSIVLISTIAVFNDSVGKTESDVIDEEQALPYGKNRRILERWVEENFNDYLIVRLPGLFGKNIKKNFLYDYMHFIPKMLNEGKYKELSEKSELIGQSYMLAHNGFYVVHNESKCLKEEFKRIGFSALNFTDSRGVFQYYNLANLWDDICLARNNHVKLLHLAVEPVTIGEVYFNLEGREFVNEVAVNPPCFDYRTNYSALWGRNDGYIKSKDQVLKEIKEFVHS